MQKDQEKANKIKEISKEIRLKNKEIEAIYAQLEITKKDANLLRNQVSTNVKSSLNG